MRDRGPLVVCVMLTRNRPQMAFRAIDCFQKQKMFRPGQVRISLLVYDTAEEPMGGGDPDFNKGEILYVHVPTKGRTIGWLRNRANELAVAGHNKRIDYFCHWDDDDWSHRMRIAEQLETIEASTASLVGYRTLPFWDTRGPVGEAWVYRNPDERWVCGSSMFYRRELWEQQPFPDAPHEDQRWWSTPLVSRASWGVSAFHEGGQPRMICHIHGGNTENIKHETMCNSPFWRREPELDQHCAEVMCLTR